MYSLIVVKIFCDSPSAAQDVGTNEHSERPQECGITINSSYATGCLAKAWFVITPAQQDQWLIILFYTHHLIDCSFILSNRQDLRLNLATAGWWTLRIVMTYHQVPLTPVMLGSPLGTKLLTSAMFWLIPWVRTEANYYTFLFQTVQLFLCSFLCWLNGGTIT